MSLQLFHTVLLHSMDEWHMFLFLQSYYQSLYKFDMVAVMELFCYKTANGKFCVNELPEFEGSAVSCWLVKDVVCNSAFTVAASSMQ